MKLEMENLIKEDEGTRSIGRIDILFKEGIYFILGAKEMGKTKLLQLLVGILKPTSGNIFFNDINIEDLGTKYKDILGYMPEDFIAYKNFNAEEYLTYMGKLKGLSNSRIRERKNFLLKKLDLYKSRNIKIGEYNNYMLKRLGVIQALLNDPKIIILDEPILGLDDVERINMMNLLSSFKEDKIIIFSLDEVNSIQYMTNEIIILKDGLIVNRGNNIEVLRILVDKVWEKLIERDELEFYNSRYIISDIKETGNKIKIRIISDKELDSSFEKLYPNLNDLFVYYFGR